MKRALIFVLVLLISLAAVKSDQAVWYAWGGGLVQAPPSFIEQLSPPITVQTTVGPVQATHRLRGFQFLPWEPNSFVTFSVLAVEVKPDAVRLSDRFTILRDTMEALYPNADEVQQLLNSRGPAMFRSDDVLKKHEDVKVREAKERELHKKTP